MALGNYNNNDSNQKKGYEPILYSPYNTSNREGIDPSALSYQFYNGLLKISISPMKAGAKKDDVDVWDHENAGAIYLTNVKARLLADEIRYVQAHPDEIYNAGVPAGNCLVSFSTGKELGAAGPCLIIRKLDTNTGEPVSSYAYQFKDNHYFGVRNYDPKNPAEHVEYNYSNTEIDMLLDILTQYSVSASGAAAYMNMYANKYDTSRLNTKIGLIMDKLGIESKPEYSKGNNGGSSYFNNTNRSNYGESSSGASMRSNTLEGLESELGD